MNDSDALRKIKELTNRLNQYSYEYYVLDAPTIDDYDFDMQMRELQVLEQQHPDLIQPDSPTQRVGGERDNTFEKVTHLVQMGSLQDVFSEEELYEKYALTAENIEFINSLIHDFDMNGGDE